MENKTMGLEFYKKEQGYYTRMGTALGLGILTALGCWSLYNKLEGITSLNENVKVWVQAGIPAVLFLVLCWAIFKVLNTPKYADFMIATEGEMKKVSWSSRKEIITSTKVVIWTVVVMSLLLVAVDFGFQFLFREIGVLKTLG
jgi:preprotein translocase subunit SecE